MPLPLDPAAGPLRGVRTRSAVHVCLLDGFELQGHRRPVTVPYSAQRVISLLALRDRPLLRAHVAGVLWPDSPEDRAGANLRSALWRLRRLPFRLVEANGSRLRLAGGVSVDARILAARAADLARGVPPLAEDVQWIARAGELLPGWYEDWLAVERERLRQLRLHALETLTRQLVVQRRYAEAVEAGLAAVAGEPLRESAHRVLIETHLAEGNVAEAIRHYLTYRDLMRSELRLGPSPHMVELLDRFLPANRRRLRTGAVRGRGGLEGLEPIGEGAGGVFSHREGHYLLPAP